MIEPEVLEGTVENIVYENADTCYAVLELLTDDSCLVTVVGQIPHPVEGERLSLTGSWTKHADYGKQFSVKSFSKKLPEDSETILRYLSSRAVHGIGPVTAKRLVEKYGRETLEVIENHPEWLADIPGISAKKAAQIHESFAEQSGIRMLLLLCRDFVGLSTVNRAYEKWGVGAADLVRRDPYALCEFPGVAFDKVDALAASLGVGFDSVSRIGGGLRYLLEYNASVNGHTCLPEGKLMEIASAHLQLPVSLIQGSLTELMAGELLASYSTSDGVTYIGLSRLMNAEKYIVMKLCQLDSSCPSFSTSDVDSMTARLEEEWGITYADEQYMAIRRALERGVMLLTGGPGTGKTTVIRALLRMFSSLGLKVALAAPTGRAAKRMSEATGNEARTIHRMLEMERAEGEETHYNRDAGNPLDEKVIIVDEVSMIDVFLLEALLRAMKRGSRILLIGDADQLPSVGAGNVLCDLIESGRFATVRLTHIFRQEKESLIITNAHRINAGEAPELSRHDADFFYLPCREDGVCDLIADLVCRRLPKAYGEQFAEGIQVITPSRKGRAGTEALNRLLRDRLNPPSAGKKERLLRDTTFRVGDRVMQIRNNYEIPWEKYGTEGTGVFNGDIGTITQIKPLEEKMVIRFDDDRVASYDGAVSEEIEHAYAITVHKSQGSEYPCVIIPMCSFPPMLLTRNLLYTAVTRAKKMVILLGRRDIVSTMVSNNRQVLRYTTLRDRLASL